MSPERLKKIEEIYHAALELPHDAREDFLRQNCDEEMRREIGSLLSFDNVENSFIDTPPESIAAEMFAQKHLPDNQNSDLTGKQINQYKILSVLGMGGMGVVYLAHDTRLERKVAIKILENEFADDPLRLNRFFQEAKAASALNHPNILTVHEIGEFGAAHYIVTEYINGKTLKHFLSEEKPSVAGVLEIAVQIASALSAAHEAGIVHRDIKPDNAMVRQDRLVKILDFGIAKLTDMSVSTEIDPEAATQIKNSITTPGMIIGTPQYMSPEQARGQKVDLRTDIFSFGVVLYEMLAGRLPFTGATNMDIIGSILRDDPAPLSQQNAEISVELERIVEKTLRKDREQRYQHIKDLLIDLSDAKKTLEFHTKPIHRTDSDTKRPTVADTASFAAQPRFSFLQVSLLILILAGAAGAAYWFFAPRSALVSVVSELKTVEVATWSSTPGETYTVGSFSPDAKMVAFTSTRGGGRNIWVKQTVSGEPIQITKDDNGNKNPVWSPNGEELAFFSTRGRQAGIWRIPVLGGSPAFISEVDSGSQLRFWSKRNLIYYETKNGLFAANTSTGEISKITDFAAKNIKPNAISPSPDEKQIAFLTLEDKTWNLWTADLQGENARRIFSGQNQIKNIVWHPDNERIFFSAAVDGTYQIFVTDTAGAPPQQITFAETDYLALDVSADGSKILFGSAKEDSDLWGVNLKDSKEFSVAAGIDSEFWADPSPDGKTVAFQSIKNLSQGNKMFKGSIMTKNIADRDKESLLTANAFLPKWSPDGKTLAFMRENGGNSHIELINPAAGGQKALTKDGITAPNYSALPYNRMQTSDFSWSPDSRKIAYVSDQSGVNNLWTINSDGSNEVQLTDGNGDLFYYCPLWSADGRRLAFTSQTNNTTGKPTFGVSVVDSETKKIDPISSGNTFIRLVGWSQSGKELILASVEGAAMSGQPRTVSLLMLPLESRKMREIVKLEETYLYNIHLSPDKKTVAFVAHRDGRDNVWTMSAAGGEARQVTGNNDPRFYFSSLAWAPDGSSIYFGKQSRFSLLSMLTNFK